MKNKINAEQTARLLKMIKEGNFQEAEGAATVLGYEGITAAFFEDVIKQHGLTCDVILAISVYYAEDCNIMDSIEKAYKYKLKENHELTGGI